MAEICRKGGISDATFYKGRAGFGSGEASDAHRLRELEAENAELQVAPWCQVSAVDR